jgi:hypothetical protein
LALVIISMLLMFFFGSCLLTVSLPPNEAPKTVEVR